MPTHKADLTRLSITQLAALVRCKPHTMRRRLDGLDPVQATGRERIYDSADALARYFTSESLDLSRERARLARAQAIAVETKNREREGTLIDFDFVRELLISLLTYIRDRLLGLPTKLALELAILSDAPSVSSALDAGVRECLVDLADGAEPAANEIVSRVQREYAKAHGTGR